MQPREAGADTRMAECCRSADLVVVRWLAGPALVQQAGRVGGGGSSRMYCGMAQALSSTGSYSAPRLSIEGVGISVVSCDGCEGHVVPQPPFTRGPRRRGGGDPGVGCDRIA